MLICGRLTRRWLALTIAAVGLAFAAVGCGDDGDSASTTEPTASLTSDAITETDLVVTDCDDDLASGIVLEAIQGSFLLQVDAPAGTGSISYTTGGEEDVGMEGPSTRSLWRTTGASRSRARGTVARRTR